MNQIKQNYQHLFEKFSSLSIEYARKNTQLSLIRVFWFVVWMLLIYFSSFYTLYIVVSAIFSGLIVFVFLVVWHNKILKKKNVFDIKRDINQFELKALQHDFSNFDDGKEFIDESHKFTHDLDIFGPFSLFQFLNRCFSPQGRQSLAGRLQKGFDEKLFIQNQQQAINELSKKSAWLQDFRVLGIHAVRSQKKKGAPIIDLSKWGNKKSIFNSISFVILVSAIFLLSTLMLYFLINGSLAFKHFILYMLLPLGISGYFAKKINIAHLELSKQSDALQQWKSVFDIAEIKLHVTEHRIYSKVCSCGHVTTSDFPLQANAPVSYGNNIESLIGYFHSRQYIPFKRMQEFVKDVFNIPISEGGIHYLLDKLVKKALPAYELIKQKLKSDTSHAVGTDETGVKVAGDKHWAWTWQNNDVTFISITDNRGMASIDKNFKDGFKNAVLVHDCWKSHFN
jgi:hypothetical protein